MVFSKHHFSCMWIICLCSYISLGMFSACYLNTVLVLLLLFYMTSRSWCLGAGLEILAFPCNQFGEEEPGTNDQITDFVCTRFKSEFPIFDKVNASCMEVDCSLNSFVQILEDPSSANFLQWLWEGFCREVYLVARWKHICQLTCFLVLSFNLFHQYACSYKSQNRSNLVALTTVILLDFTKVWFCVQEFGHLFSIWKIEILILMWCVKK
jgi:hypothetical protein